MSKLYETTIALNAELSSAYKGTFATAIKTQKDWDDALMATQQHAAEVSGLAVLAEKIASLKEDMEGIKEPTQAQADELKYLEQEYTRAAEALGMVGKSQEEVKQKAKALNDAFERQTIAAMTNKQAEAAQKDTRGVITLRREVDRLTKEYKKNKSQSLERDLIRQTRALQAMEKRTGLATRSTEELIRREQQLAQQLKGGGGFAKIGSVLGDVGGKVGRIAVAMGKGFGIAGGVLGGAAAVGMKAVNFASEIGDKMQELNYLAFEFGTTTQSVQKLGYVFQSGGVSFEKYSNAMRKMQMQMEEARRSPGKAREDFQKLGITMKDLETLKVDQVLEKITGNVHLLGDQAEITKVGMELMGRDGVRMFNIMAKEGKAGFETLKSEATEAGMVMSDADFKRADAYNAAMLKMNAASESFKMTLGVKLMPTITDVFGTAEMMAKDLGGAWKTATDSWASGLSKVWKKWSDLVTLPIFKDKPSTSDYNSAVDGAISNANTLNSAKRSEGNITFNIEQKIDLSGNSGDLRQEALTGSSAGAQELATQLEAVLHQQRRVAYK